MDRITHVSRAALVMLMVFASEVMAQRTPARPATRRPAQQPAPVKDYWELGTDMNLGVGLDDPKSFFVNIPTGTVRAGYYVSDILSIEPALSFNSLAQESATALTAWTIQTGVLYHLSRDRGRTQLFVHPAVGFTGGSGLNRTLTSLIGNFGIKYPLIAGRLLLRGEAGLTYRFESGPFAARTNFIVTGGWSLYTK